MQQPDSTTPIAKCETLAQYTQAALRRYVTLFQPGDSVRAQLEELATRVGVGSTALVGAHGAYRTSVLALIGPRVEVKLVDLKADDVVRSVKRAAEEAKVADSVFANGITPIVRPVGQTEVDELVKLEGKIAAASSWSEREAARARIAAVRAEYATALTARKAALVASGAARAVRDSAKEDFLDLYASVAGAIKSLFPRDRARQDAFFDAVRASAASDDADDTDEPGTPATPS